MNSSYSVELYWLVLTILMTSLFWIPYIINRMAEQGFVKAIWDPYGHTDTQRHWANRMMQAHKNAIENLVVFTPLVIVIQITEINSVTTEIACITYFFARLIHYFVFTFAIPVLRVVSFLAGFSAQLTLAIVLLKHMAA